MDRSRRFEPHKDPTSGGEFEFLQHSSSNTDSTVTTIGRDSTSETPIAGSSTTSVHAVFNLDTKKVMDAIKETRELLNGKNIDKNTTTKSSANSHHRTTKSKTKKPKKKVSASWTAEWSEDTYQKNETKTPGKLLIMYISMVFNLTTV